MTQLPDYLIHREIDAGIIMVEPFDQTAVQPASLDVRLGQRFIVEAGSEYKLEHGEVIGLQPGAFVLGELLETLTLPSHYAARLEGKSTLARNGLAIHITAGFVDPGFSGRLTLEMKNMNEKSVVNLTVGMRVGQLTFHRLMGAAVRPYGSPDLNNHYQYQGGVTPGWRSIREAK